MVTTTPTAPGDQNVGADDRDHQREADGGIECGLSGHVMSRLARAALRGGVVDLLLRPGLASADF
jgi:hypothetical protein